nr:DUF3800 domain-containing protein [Candidatus Desulfatibia profunda]
MYFLYLDESGSNTSHFVLLGLAIPATSWKAKTDQITPIKKSVLSSFLCKIFISQFFEEW